MISQPSLFCIHKIASKLQSPRPCFSEKICLHPFLRNFPGLKSRQSTSSDGATSTRAHHLPASLRTIYRPVCAPSDGQFAHHLPASLRTFCRQVCAPPSGQLAHHLLTSLRTNQKKVAVIAVSTTRRVWCRACQG
jgi:hypothetical protein